MADNFFGFDAGFPPKNVLGRKGLDEELLTADVEDEYDALNDETFGHAANDDWEEAHEKLSELIIEKSNLSGSSIFNDSLLENDESQDEIVSKSISQLGLEDDLDDPAIMTIARNCNSLHGRLRPFRSSSSPPPPAILETESCGSPKTHSIWSTTPKDSGITSFLQSLNHTSSGLSRHDTSTPLKSASDNVFITPPKAWRAEELEKDMLSSSQNEPANVSSWPQVPQLPIGGLQNAPNASPPPRFPSNLGQNRNKIAMDRMLTREEVERQMHSDPRLCIPGNVPNYVPQQMIPPGMQQNLMSPIGSARNNNINAPNHSSPMGPLRPPLRGRGPMLGANGMMPNPYFANARMNMMHNQMPMRGPPMPNLPPGFNPSNININHKLLSLPPRSIAHPLLQKQFQYPMVVYNNHYENEELIHSSQGWEDEYAGLMTQREKEWLLRIQLLQLKSENPYIEDYYYTTQVARRCQKKYSESANKGAGDAPELILPETTKHENKAFVPTQFEGSLGKLQAVSVNFPRKVLDWTEKRPLEDEEGKIVTNQSQVKHRKLLLDIELLYRHFLEIEDEERRILAKPETESGQHRENIAKLMNDIVAGLLNNTAEDYFQNIMIIRKGRSLVMRCFKIFNKEQKLKCLVLLFRYLPVIVKKDQNDLILVRHLNMIVDVIKSLSLPKVVQLGEALKDSHELGKGKEKSSFSTLLKSSFGSSVTCTLLTEAEFLYEGFDLFESDIQTRWANVVMNIVESLCSLPTSSIVFPETPCHNLLSHFQRFAVDSDKLDLLKEKLAELEPKTKESPRDA